MVLFTDSEVKRAMEFAALAHKGQLRKYLEVPYYLHLIEVAEIASTVDEDKELHIAALLHDTLEDTTTTWVDLATQFSIRVADLVQQVTNPSKLSDGNRTVRKLIDLKHLMKAEPTAQTLKYADLLSNTPSISSFAPGFAKLYMRECRDIWAALDKGNKRLRDLLDQALSNYEHLQGNLDDSSNS